MEKFAFFLKTYSHDEIRAKQLIETYRKYNKDNIKMFLMCPKDDMVLFGNIQGDDVSVIAEESIKTEVFEEDATFKAGYLNQEIYKLAFWELGLCENYQCLDSDGIFIRPFCIKDFMYDENIPYTTLVEDNDLKSDLYYNELYWNGRLKWIRKIEDEMDFHPYKLLTCHGFQIFSYKVLSSLKNSFMEKKGYTYKDLIEIAPYEFSWYSLWLQKSECMPIRVCEPNFKTIHIRQQHINEVLRGMTLDDWAKGYLGLIVNSNFDINDGKYDDLSLYTGENCGLNMDSVKRTFFFYGKILRGKILARIKRTIFG